MSYPIFSLILLGTRKSFPLISKESKSHYLCMVIIFLLQLGVIPNLALIFVRALYMFLVLTNLRINRSKPEYFIPKSNDPNVKLWYLWFRLGQMAHEISWPFCLFWLISWKRLKFDDGQSGNNGGCLGDGSRFDEGLVTSEVWYILYYGVPYFVVWD